MKHPFQCRCGTLRGEISQAGQAMRAICYCSDCQAYAHVLGQPAQVLDAHGGTDIVAVQSGHVRFTAGTGALACASLSPRGLLRWYASCCDTPIANTPRDWHVPYAGMVHTCLRQPQPMEQAFPRVQMQVNARSAHGTPPRLARLPGLVRLFRMMLRFAGARLRGSYRSTPFFDAQGAPVVPVRVIDRAAVQAARAAAARQG